MLNCLSVVKKKRKSNTGKLHVYIPANKMVAVGPRISDFVTEISIIDQRKLPWMSLSGKIFLGMQKTWSKKFW